MNVGEPALGALATLLFINGAVFLAALWERVRAPRLASWIVSDQHLVGNNAHIRQW